MERGNEPKKEIQQLGILWSSYGIVDGVSGGSPSFVVKASVEAGACCDVSVASACWCSANLEK